MESYVVQIKLTNLRTQLEKIDSQFLAELSPSELSTLLEKIKQVETKIRIELQNTNKK